MFSAEDNVWMVQALRLAEQGLTSTSPNPRVGCVLIKDEKIIGSGWHQRAGEPHAEVYALREAGEAAHGATAYVTLEPCAHQGKTPPCADALIAGCVARVVVAVQDPNPLVAGKGIEKLRAAGIPVECGLMEAAARELNVGFFARMTRGTPWLRSKIAMSLDGRTALANGVSQWITGDAARQDVQHWRARSCAVLTGINTILADDAQLNVRDVETSRQPLRVVLDSQLRIPLGARILTPSPTGGELPARGMSVVVGQQAADNARQGWGSVLIYTATQQPEKIVALEKNGATVVVLPNQNGQVDLPAMLKDLAQRGINEVLVEAGSILNGALLRAGLVDELVLYLAPQLLGDVARGMASLGELTQLDQSVELQWQDVRQVGNDLRILVSVKNG
ncbi:MAG: bifunctional diaminohydroxyphosphoribosylaminopyrimidine deaminase/5-amino-6-(5-phosphoribosylamino)uracil reductase RibD [Gallionella sp.]